MSVEWLASPSFTVVKGGVHHGRNWTRDAGRIYICQTRAVDGCLRTDPAEKATARNGYEIPRKYHRKYTSARLIRSHIAVLLNRPVCRAICAHVYMQYACARASTCGRKHTLLPASIPSIDSCALSSGKNKGPSFVRLFIRDREPRSCGPD